MILRSYKTNFGKDLVEDIKSETSGNFEKLLVALLTPIIDYYVKELHDAMSGLGTDEDVLIEILCSMTNYEIHTIKNAYERCKFNLLIDRRQLIKSFLMLQFDYQFSVREKSRI